MDRTDEDPLVAKAFDPKAPQEELVRAIAQLKPEEAAFFLHRLEAALRKRKIQLTGYLVAMGAWLVGMTLALVYYGLNDGSALWAFIVPFGIVGAILYAFGSWADRVGKRPPPATAKAPAAAASAGARPDGPTPGPGSGSAAEP